MRLKRMRIKRSQYNLLISSRKASMALLPFGLGRAEMDGEGDFEYRSQ
jgi:hypothetical protein